MNIDDLWIKCATVNIEDLDGNKSTLMTKDNFTQAIAEIISSPVEPGVMQKPAGKWISIKDQLPEPMENVLVSLENGWTILIGKYRNQEQGWTCFYADGEQIAYVNLVTHWMSLPEPPES